MIRNRLYTKDEVLQVVEAALSALDNTEAPTREPEHLDNDISQKSSPVNAKVTILISRQSLMDWLKEGDSYEEAC